MMTNINAPHRSIKNLIKILIGAAWLDGIVQTEERDYLRRLAQENGLANDPELYPLLHELKTVKPDECYAWVRQYLGDHPTQEDCQSLIETISGLIYSDGDVANEEARLLTRLQEIELSCDVKSGTCSNNVPDLLRRLYRRWLAVIGD
jgi:uncharacterized tellurite resistance protein B-like protein